VTVSYVLFSIIFMVFFMMILLSANDLLVQGPSNIVVKAEFDDIGNLMGSSITDMYLIAPENGIINTSYRIPSSIGKEPYIIDIIQNSDAADEIIEVSSSVSDKKVNVTLNGMSEIGVNGTAYSSMSSHRIIYDSKNNNS
jgi:hypothetical protein